MYSINGIGSNVTKDWFLIMIYELDKTLYCTLFRNYETNDMNDIRFLLQNFGTIPCLRRAFLDK